jgi:hypothetical protein
LPQYGEDFIRGDSLPIVKLAATLLQVLTKVLSLME